MGGIADTINDWYATAVTKSNEILREVQDSLDFGFGSVDNTNTAKQRDLDLTGLDPSAPVDHNARAFSTGMALKIGGSVVALGLLAYAVKKALK